MAIIYKVLRLTPKKNDILSFFFGKSPMEVKEVELLRQENKQLRQANRELEEKLFLYVESGDAHIHRMMFRTYMLAALDRKETDAEWMKFIDTFSFNTLPLSIKIYEWIDRFVDTPVTVKEMKMDLESSASASVSGESHSVSYPDSQADSTVGAFEFRPIRIELESWPSDSSVKTDE
jgi:hypothetical protein